MNSELNGIQIKWEVLSILRFFFAFIVACGHLMMFTDTGILVVFHYLGSFEAILGFLLISGFSIGKSIQRNPENFMLRRLKRIYPVYIASIILTYLVKMNVLDISFIYILIINLFFLNQLIINHSYVGGAWTLALEMWLYLCAGLINKLTYNKQWVIILISFACYVVYTCLRTLLDMPYYNGTNFGINILFLSFIWIAGFNLAKYEAFYSKSMKRVGVLLFLHIGLITLIKVAYRYKNGELMKFFSDDIITYFCHGLVLILLYVAFSTSHEKLKISAATKKVFDFLGNISYPLYLCHIPSYIIAEKYGVKNPYLYILIAIAVSTIVYIVFDFYSKNRVKKEKVAVV